MKKIYVFGLALGLAIIMVFLSSHRINGEINYENIIYRQITVSSGDTLWSLASEYNSSGVLEPKEYVDLIKEVNNLGSDKIMSGTHLVMPVFPEIAD